jgi:hypothetical protein
MAGRPVWGVYRREGLVYTVTITPSVHGSLWARNKLIRVRGQGMGHMEERASYYPNDLTLRSKYANEPKHQQHKPHTRHSKPYVCEYRHYAYPQWFLHLPSAWRKVRLGSRWVSSLQYSTTHLLSTSCQLCTVKPLAACIVIDSATMAQVLSRRSYAMSTYSVIGSHPSAGAYVWGWC